MADTYRQDEIQEILQIAIAHHTSVDELSRQQLFEIADELGLTAQQIQSAERDWLVGRQSSCEHQEFQRYRRIRFRQHLIKYAITNGFLMLFDLTTFGDGTLTLSFSLYIALMWGLFLTLDGWKAVQREGDDYERAFQRWKRRHWLQKSAQRLLKQWWPPSAVLRGR
ncbi:MAG: 2TM domain-containing protein [Elainellaceae cyanobacterium]